MNLKETFNKLEHVMSLMTICVPVNMSYSLLQRSKRHRIASWESLHREGLWLLGRKEFLSEEFSPLEFLPMEFSLNGVFTERNFR